MNKIMWPIYLHVSRLRICFAIYVGTRLNYWGQTPSSLITHRNYISIHLFAIGAYKIYPQSASNMKGFNSSVLPSSYMHAQVRIFAFTVFRVREYLAGRLLMIF